MFKNISLNWSRLALAASFLLAPACDVEDPDALIEEEDDIVAKEPGPANGPLAPSEVDAMKAVEPDPLEASQYCCGSCETPNAAGGFKCINCTANAGPDPSWCPSGKTWVNCEGSATFVEGRLTCSS